MPSLAWRGHRCPTAVFALRLLALRLPWLAGLLAAGALAAHSLAAIGRVAGDRGPGRQRRRSRCPASRPRGGFDLRANRPARPQARGWPGLLLAAVLGRLGVCGAMLQDNHRT